MLALGECQTLSAETLVQRLREIAPMPESIEVRSALPTATTFDGVSVNGAELGAPQLSNLLRGLQDIDRADVSVAHRQGNEVVSGVRVTRDVI